MEFLPALLAACAALAQTWTIHPAGTTASLRGASAVTPKIAWASGTGGTYLQTTDGGATWRAATVPGAEKLDFRDIQAFDDRTAYLLSSGPGGQSRIYKTTDAGRHWILQFTNPDSTGFFDALAFWDARTGIVLGDPVGGAFTDPHHRRWRRALAAPRRPAVARKRRRLRSQRHLPDRHRPQRRLVRHRRPRRRARLPFEGPRPHLDSDSHAGPQRRAHRRHLLTGIPRRPPRHRRRRRLLQTRRQLPQHRDHLRRRPHLDGTARPSSEPATVPPWPTSRAVKSWIAVGPTGSDISHDEGETWQPFDTAAYNASASRRNGSGFAVGPQGRLAQFKAASPARPSANPE